MSKTQVIAVLLLATGFSIGGGVLGWWGYQAGAEAERAANKQRAELNAARQASQEALEENRRLTQEAQALRVEITELRARAAVPVPTVPPPPVGLVEMEILDPPTRVHPRKSLPKSDAVETPDEKSTTLKRVTAGGDQAELSDGSIWEPMISHQARLAKWESGTVISVVPSGEFGWEHRLVNRKRGETVDVKLMTPGAR